MEKLNNAISRGNKIMKKLFLLFIKLCKVYEN